VTAMFGRRPTEPPRPPIVVMPPAPPGQGNAIEKKDSGIFGADGTVKGLGESYGDRPWQRRTHSTPDRTRAVGMMEAYGITFGFPELVEAARKTSHSWAAEEGWDTEMFVKAVGAAKSQPPAVQFGGDSRPPGR
jgi:hypothetical protein